MYRSKNKDIMLKIKSNDSRRWYASKKSRRDETAEREHAHQGTNVLYTVNPS